MEITIRDIFQAMPDRFNAEAAEGWTSDIQFHFSGDGGDEDWCLRVADQTCTVIEGTVDTPSATIRTSSGTWIGMITGDVDPMVAFAGGLLKIEGNIGDVMRLQSPVLFRRV
ncbi:MAG TPA: SCP2 sterol-binding domain-containing protein [Myxococcota bacterium]|nr:SCP2 sterol-binding domain-containing protein [Myxococcota bacterium]